MMPTEKRTGLASLLSAIVDGRADDVEMERLDALLTDDDDAQSYYLHYLAVHADLEKGGEPSAAAQPHPVRHTTPARKWATVALATAACALIGLALVFWFQNPENQNTEQPIAIEAPFEVIAVVGNVDGAVWDFLGQAPETGVQLGRGEIRLEKGRVRLDFNAGEKVTVEAPAVFELVDHKRLSLKLGNLVASVAPQGKGFTVILPNGAVVDLGTEFAVSVGADGKDRVKVLKGAVKASSTNSQGHTSWEKVLIQGDEYSIVAGAPLVRERASNEYPLPLPTSITQLSLDAAYARAVIASNPIGFWRFDEVDHLGRIRNETGRVSLQLMGMAGIQGSGQGGFLVPSQGGQAGFAISSEGFLGLNTARGCSIEFWMFSDSVEWQALAALMLDGPRPEGLLPKHARHSPHLLLVERAGTSGSNQDHVHPNFAMRGLSRSPAGYQGGVNAYSEAAYLIHRWHHIVVVKASERFQIYVDGELSGESQPADIFDEERYSLLLGRLHPLANSVDSRPLSGAIDELALYRHALEQEEIRRHYQASQRDAE